MENEKLFNRFTFQFRPDISILYKFS